MGDSQAGRNALEDFVPMEQRLRFVTLARNGRFTATELCGVTNSHQVSFIHIRIDHQDGIWGS